MMGAKQLKVELRVRDLERSCDLYLRLGFREIPNTDQPHLTIRDSVVGECPGWAGGSDVSGERRRPDPSREKRP